jgi:hypothetical protein
VNKSIGNEYAKDGAKCPPQDGFFGALFSSGGLGYIGRGNSVLLSSEVAGGPGMLNLGVKLDEVGERIRCELIAQERTRTERAGARR